MAKSIRSKWKRKCRAVKRIRYGEKELERLKKTLANDPVNKNKEANDSVMSDIETIANVKTAKQIQEENTEAVMDVEEIKKKYNPKTLRDKNGAYPIWVHPRKLKKNKKKKRQF